MDTIELRLVTKVFRHRPAFFGWLGHERTGETKALNRVSLSAEAGRVMVLLGPNGSGKTTLLKLVSTMLLPDSGEVLVNSANTSLQGAEVRRRVGFAVATERSFFPRLTALENLEFFATFDEVSKDERDRRIVRVLEQVGLTDAANTLAIKFSSGMYQRLGVARALMKNPSVLLLDEPTRSLDPRSAQEVWALVREIADQGATVLLTTHNFAEAVAVGDSVAILQKGNIVETRALQAVGTAEDLRSIYFKTIGDTEQLPTGQAGR